MRDSNHKGNVAEAAITAAAIKLGIPVVRPIVEHTRYDLIFDLQPRLLRVQCKWVALKDGVIPVPLTTSRCNSQGKHLRRRYTAEEIDAVAAYCEELDECYLIPIEAVEGMWTFQLRVEPARNGQKAALNWATDYRLGAVAQLEERCHGMAEVRGSSPLSSTRPLDALHVGAHEFRNRFGWYLERAAAGEEFSITRRGKSYARLGPPPSHQPELSAGSSAGQCSRNQAR